MATAGIILCGGHSTRMGSPKAWLPFGSELLLPRVARILSNVVDRILVVAAVDQRLPPLPAGVEIALDTVPDQGPLQGLAAGLDAIQTVAETVFVTSCDAPLLSPALVTLLLQALPGFDAAIPLVQDRPQPLTAAYSTSVLPRVEQLLANGQRRMRDLADAINTHWLPEDPLRTVDPQLLSLRNANTPEEYAAALLLAGL